MQDSVQKQRVVLIFDIGTQSARALLIANDGTILAKEQTVYEPPYISDRPGMAEQDPDMYYACMCKCSAGLRVTVPDLFARIEAVSVSTIRETSVCVDAEGKPLRPAIVWLDKRLADGHPKTGALMKPVLKLLGVDKLLDQNYRKSQCNWIMQHEPEIWEKTHKFLMLGGYLNYRLTGRFADAVAGLAGHIPFDNKARTWKTAHDLTRPVFDIPDEKLPEPVETGELLGHISQAAAEETGLPAGLPVFPSGADKACEVIGLGCMEKEQVAISFGTMATADFHSKDYYELTKWIPPLPSVMPGRFTPEYETYSGYWLVSWFQKEFAELERITAKTAGQSAIEILNSKLEQIPPGCEGLMFQPYFTPSPEMPYARGGFVGMSDHHGRIHMYRAVIEGINYSLLEGVRKAERAGHFKAKEIRLGGGGSQSQEICQITANMFGIPVVRVHTHEVTGVGSAVACFVALGEYADFEEAVAGMVHEKDRFVPEMDEHRFYMKLYDVWKDIFRTMTPLYSRVRRIYEDD